MTIDPHIAKLGNSLLEVDIHSVENALLEIDDLLSNTLESNRVDIIDADARVFLRSRLSDCIDIDPLRPVASTAIWVLGKLYDKSLETYFANLASLYLEDDKLLFHLHQVVIALDNLDAIPSFEDSAIRHDPSVMRALVREYLSK